MSNLDKAAKNDKAAQAEKIFDILSQTILKPETELNYNNAFELLVAVCLSAQTRDAYVNRITPELFKIAPDAVAMAALPLEQLETQLRSLGFYRQKARNLHLLCDRLIRVYNSQVPSTKAELLTLAGVGPKSANVVLNTIFNQATIGVDTHVFRVSKRLGLSQGTNVRQVERDLMSVVPQKYQKDAHHYLVLHGRYTCLAKRPKCESCPLTQHCNYFQQIFPNRAILTIS